MRRSEYGPLDWSLAPPVPGTVAKFRRWNKALIAILFFLVLGAFVAAEAPRTASESNASLKENASPASVQHANSSKSEPPAMHGPAGSGHLGKDAMGAHHTG